MFKSNQIIKTGRTVARAMLTALSAFLMPDMYVRRGLRHFYLGEGSDHYYVGYYDKDPVSAAGTHILCHRVRAEYTEQVEPEEASIGLLSLAGNSFFELDHTRAVNWQLASRAQWLDENTIIFNDIIDGYQRSVKFDCVAMKRVAVYDRPFWDISHDKLYAASLNFSRIKNMRPGYGYTGLSIDGDDEILTVFDLDNGQLIHEISLDDILFKVNFVNGDGDDVYLNHIVWSPCNKKLLTIFHYNDRNTDVRRVLPVLIHLPSLAVDRLYDGGDSWHHTFLNEEQILAYLRADKEFFYAIWSKSSGWVKVEGSMPKKDGHPSMVAESDKVVVDTYPDRLGIMSLYWGSTIPGAPLTKLIAMRNPPRYSGPLRCDLHPRVSIKHELVICDVPSDNGRKILVIEGVLDVQ